MRMRSRTPNETPTTAPATTPMPRTSVQSSTSVTDHHSTPCLHMIQNYRIIVIYSRVQMPNTSENANILYYIQACFLFCIISSLFLVLYYIKLVSCFVLYPSLFLVLYYIKLVFHRKKNIFFYINTQLQEIKPELQDINVQLQVIEKKKLGIISYNFDFITCSITSEKRSSELWDKKS